MNWIPRGGKALWGALLLVLLTTGCSSDEFGPTGGTLPSDVSQDSLAVELVLEGTRDETRVDVPDVPLDERQILYFGGSAVSGWQATPLVRYAFDSPDSIDVESLQPGDLKSVRLALRLMLRDAERGGPLTIEVRELSQTLDPDFRGDLADVLGDTLATFGASRGPTIFLDFLDEERPLEQVEALRARFLAWMQAGGHDGLALVNASPDSVFIGLAAEEFDVSRNGGLLTEDQIPVGAVIASRITVTIQRPEEEEVFVTYGVLDDLTHFVEPAARGPVTLASHLPARAWLDFDLNPVPRAATINGAELVLTFDRPRVTLTGFPGDETYTDADGDGEEERSFENSTLLPRSGTVLVYEATRSEAESGSLAGLSQVQSALSIFSTDRVVAGTEEDDDLLRINVTDFVQRAVNGLFEDSPPGLLVVLDGEALHFLDAGFFDSQAAADLQPRIELTYTPPADFVD
jgi:hypothetical protein